MSAGSALGPLPFGFVHDLSGSYFVAWVASGAVTAVNAVFCWHFMAPPVKTQPEVRSTAANSPSCFVLRDSPTIPHVEVILNTASLLTRCGGCAQGIYSPDREKRTASEQKGLLSGGDDDES